MEEKSKRTGYVAVAAALLFVGTTIALAQYKVPSIMSSLGEMFSMDLGVSSWLMSTLTLVGVVLALPTGGLAKRFGPKPMMLASCVIVIAGAIVGAFSANAAMLIVSRAIEGVALIFVTVCGPLAVQKYVAPEKVGSATGIWATWVSLGSFLGGVLTPTLFEAAGFKGVWLVFAAATAVAAVVLAIVVRPFGSDALEKEAEAADADADAPAQPARYREFFTRQTIPFFGVFLVFNLILLAVLSYTPTFLQSEGVDASVAGFASTLPMLISIVSTPALGALIDRGWNPKILLLVGIAVMGPCACVMLCVSSPVLWVAAVVMGVASMSAPSCFLTIYPRLLGRPELMAVGMGLFMLIQSLGQFFGSFLISLFVSQGWVFTGVTVVILGFVATFLLALVKVPRS